MNCRMLENNHQGHPIMEIVQRDFLEVAAKLSRPSSYSILCLCLAVSHSFPCRRLYIPLLLKDFSKFSQWISLPSCWFPWQSVFILRLNRMVPAFSIVVAAALGTVWRGVVVHYYLLSEGINDPSRVKKKNYTFYCIWGYREIQIIIKNITGVVGFPF